VSDTGTIIGRSTPWLAAPLVVSVLCMVIWARARSATRVATEISIRSPSRCCAQRLAGLVAGPLVAASGAPGRRPNRHSRPAAGRVGSVGLRDLSGRLHARQDRTSAMHGVAILAGLPVFTGCGRRW
jgi:hypothetical protein